MQQTQQKPMTIMPTGVRRPAWITAGAKQRAVLVRDRSGSMSGQKAQDASAASSDLIAELARPANRDGFEVAVIDFHGSADIIHDISPATALAGKVESIKAGGGTDITSGLQAALEVIGRRGADGTTYLRPVVVVFSDGNSGGPEAVADKIKAIADVVTVAFGADANEPLLQKLASSPQHFYRCRNGAELRAFFAAVGATLTASLQRRESATRALSQIRLQ